jgi:hypothetical protein
MSAKSMQEIKAPTLTASAVENPRAEEVQNSGLPSAEEFFSLIDDERKLSQDNLSGYTVYHKYSKSC